MLLCGFAGTMGAVCLEEPNLAPEAAGNVACSGAAKTGAPAPMRLRTLMQSTRVHACRHRCCELTTRPFPPFPAIPLPTPTCRVSFDANRRVQRVNLPARHPPHASWATQLASSAQQEQPGQRLAAVAAGADKPLFSCQGLPSCSTSHWHQQAHHEADTALTGSSVRPAGNAGQPRRQSRWARD